MRRLASWRITACAIVFVARTLTSDASAQEVASPDDASALAAPLRAEAARLPRLRSVLVSWRGQLVAEHYATGVRATTPANIKSAAKSVLAALTGIAIDRGHIKDVRTPIVTWFPELRSDKDT